MNLKPDEIIDMCSKHYNEWKKEALNSRTKEEMMKYLNKSFFWLELQSNLLVLWTIRNTFKDDQKIQEKAELAESNINKKIMDYIETVVSDMK